MKNKKLINSIIGIGVFLLYIIYLNCQNIPLQLFGIDPNAMAFNQKIIYLIIYEVVFIVILFLIYKKQFKNDAVDFKNNFKPYLRKYIEYWAFAFALMIASNLIILQFFPTAIANNQESINSIFEVAPLYMIVSAVIFAPIIEETVFRLGFRNIFSSDKLYIFMSGIIFGSMHVVGSINSWFDLFYLIPYSIPGWVFAYTLIKSKNIFVPMSLHLFHNGFMMFLQVVLALL